MLEKRILINEDGIPMMEIKTNSYTVVRRPLNAGEQADFDAGQKEGLSAEVEVKTEGGASKAPPVVSPPLAETAPKTKVKTKAKHKSKPLGAPSG